MASWIGVVIGIIGLAFGVFERSQRTKTEQIFRENLRRLAGAVRVVWSNANWADTHLRTIGYLFLEPNPDINAIRKRVHDGARDAAACARQLGLAHSQIKGIQRTLFNDGEEILPEIETDDVVAARAKIAAGSQTLKKNETRSLPPSK